MYYGEYLYAADNAPHDENRRSVFSWRPGCPINKDDREISVGTIRNIYQNEYMYPDDMSTTNRLYDYIVPFHY